MWAAEKNVHDYSMPIPTHLTQFWILSRLGDCVEKMNNAFKCYDIYICSSKFKTFFYKEFCDVFLVKLHYQTNFIIYLFIHSTLIILGDM